jgi:hypothetical protein
MPRKVRSSTPILSTKKPWNVFGRAASASSVQRLTTTSMAAMSLVMRAPMAGRQGVLCLAVRTFDLRAGHGRRKRFLLTANRAVADENSCKPSLVCLH